MSEHIPQVEGTEPITPDEASVHTLVVPPRPSVSVSSYEGNPVRDHAIASFAAVMAMGLVVTLAISSWQQPRQTTVSAVPAVPVVYTPAPPTTPNPFSVINIEARSAIVYDVQKNTSLFELRAQDKRPLASLTKMMTGLLASEALDKNTHVAVTPHAIETEGDSGLLANETWRLGDLVSFLMMSSSNDGADAVAAAVGTLWELDPSSTPEYVHVDTFVGQMNNKASELGLTQTHYRNPSGLDEPNGSLGGEGSAEDMSQLLAYIWKNSPEAIADTTKYEKTFTSVDGFIHDAQNTNEFVNGIPGLLGSKTGYTELAGGNLAIIYDAGMAHPIVIVVLGSSVDGRFVDVQTLIDATYKYVESGWYEYEVAGSTPRG